MKERILYTETISIPQILRDLEAFEGIIMESLMKGERNFLIPKSVKELEAYKDPYKEQGVRAVVAWNYMYPDQEIQLPEKVDIVKVKMTKLEDISELEETQPDIYNRLVRFIYKGKTEKLVKKGIEVVAIPRNAEGVPKWLLPYIDYTGITNDNISRFYSVINSLEVETIKASDKKYFTNIMNI